MTTRQYCHCHSPDPVPYGKGKRCNVCWLAIKTKRKPNYVRPYGGMNYIPPPAPHPLLPTWATPIEFARTHAIRLCDCQSHYPAVATVSVTLTKRVLVKDPTTKDKRYRQRKEMNVHPAEEELPQYEVTSYDIEYHLCPLCLLWEREIRGEIDYQASEMATTILQAAYERVGYSYSDDAARTINGVAERAYAAANKKQAKPKAKRKQPAAAPQKTAAA